MTQGSEGDGTLEDEIFGMGSKPDAIDRPEHVIIDPAPAVRRPRAERGPLIKWQPTSLPARRDLGLGGAGAATFFFVDVVVMWAPLTRNAPSGLTAQTITLLVVAFGLGGLLAWYVRGALRPYGFGMMAGWAFLTLLSAGFLTGVSP
jgi:hypothetical protein